MFELRDYQVSAIEAALNWIKYKPDESGFITAAGGAGKSIMIAKIAEAVCDMGRRVVILARNEKLLRQNRAKISPSYDVGIYCAGLGEWEYSKPITVASIQSISNLQEPIAPDLILCDEAHNISQNSDDETQYWEFFKRCGNPQVIGLTATPFRTGSGKLQWGKEIINIPIKPLFDAGYIVPPITKCAVTPDLSNVRVRLGEYVEADLEDVFLIPEMLVAAVAKIKQYSATRNSVLIFCQSLRHCDVLARAMADNDMPAVVVSGDTPKKELSSILQDFEHKKFKYLVNCNLLTEGYDAPQIDMIVVLRATISKGLFEQMVYRGTRLYEGKTNFLLLDMGGNLQKHGGLGSPYREKSKREQERPEGKSCPECDEFLPMLARECSSCGYQYPEAELKKVSHEVEHDTTSAPVWEGGIETHDVIDVGYREHKSKAGNVTIRVDYYCAGVKYGKISEWYSPYHENEWARAKFERMIKDRGHMLGSPCQLYKMEDLLWHCEQMKKPARIVVSYAEKFPRVVRCEFDNQAPVAAISDVLGGDEIPF